MNAKICDVVGCGQPAYWVRVAQLHTNDDRNICQSCWVNLRSASESQARCYAPKDDPEGAALAYSSGARADSRAVDPESELIC